MNHHEYTATNQPYQERMPTAFEKDRTPARFDEIVPDYFWTVANWVVGAIITMMGGCTLVELFTKDYNILLAISWVATAGFGLTILAIIQKWILNK